MGAKDAWNQAAEQLGFEIDKRSAIRKDPQSLSGVVEGVTLRLWWLPPDTDALGSDGRTYVDASFAGAPLGPSGLRIRRVSPRKAKRLLKKAKAVALIERSDEVLAVEAADSGAAEVWLTPARREALAEAFGTGSWTIEVSDGMLRAFRTHRLEDAAEIQAAAMEGARVALLLR